MKKFSYILGTGGYLPAKTLSNKDMEKIVDTTDEWIVERTGIRNRHIMGPDENTTSMALAAAQRAIEAAKIDPKKIQLIIVATSLPDNLFPNTAVKVQKALGLDSKDIPAFDISAACSGFIYALSIADQYIKNGSVENALIIGSESLSRIVDWSDRTTCILFSDGAGAAVIGASDEPGVYSTHLHANGSYTDLLYLSGSLYDYKNPEPRYLRMRGNEVFKVAVNKLGSVVDETLTSNKIDKSEIDWLVPHQANLRIITAMAKKLNVSMDKVILTIEDQANTSAASIPLALDIGIRDGRIKRGDLMLLEAFGAGFVWGASLIRY
jgi:3-oxoacyl-[acyl-carrier-protein] synthase-3